jgi:predicted glycosyltransferase
MKIWIDLANAPHVGFFLPIIHELKKRGYEVAISMRDFNQTVELARKNGLEGTVIGTHGGATSLGKVFNLLGRSFQLARFGRELKVDVAVSHNSYTHTIAGRLIGTKVITIMDYEGQPANHIAFRAAHRVIVPASFPDKALKKYGCAPGKAYKYVGFKEQVYLSSFTPNPGFQEELVRACGLGPDWKLSDKILVTVRTPANMAAYHRFKNELFEKLLSMLERHMDLTVILLPRTPVQREYYTEKYPGIKIPKEPLSGNDLMYYSDVVVSAGGTMNREAAILGTPVYTIFAGVLPAVDEQLIKMKRLVSIESESDIAHLVFAKKRAGDTLANPGLCNEIVDHILDW